MPVISREQFEASYIQKPITMRLYWNSSYLSSLLMFRRKKYFCSLYRTVWKRVSQFVKQTDWFTVQTGLVFASWTQYALDVHLWCSFCHDLWISSPRNVCSINLSVLKQITGLLPNLQPLFRGGLTKMFWKWLHLVVQKLV